MRGAAVSGEGGRDLLPAAANKIQRGSPENRRFFGEGNMLPGIFLPILYIPLVNWISGLF